MEKWIEGWRVVKNHRVFHFVVNIFESEGRVFEEGQEVKPFYFVTAIKIWSDFVIDRKSAPTGILITISCGGGDTREEIENHVKNIWEEREKQEWYPEFLDHFRKNVKPKYLKLISDFANTDKPQ